MLAGGALIGQSGASQDLTELSLEQILDAKVYSASKLEQRASEAPASVTVITSDEIRQFGWRTLSEVLRSVRGFYVQTDRVEDFLGVRGLARPGDYNTRVLLLLDGYSLNDNVYDEALTSSAFPLDLDLIERIEIVRGPGSVLYGGNALFGVINVITRSAANLAPGEAALRTGRYGSYSASVSVAKQFAQGGQLLLSLAHGWSRGADAYFPEFDAPDTNSGRTNGTDFQRESRAFGKFSSGSLNLVGGVSRRLRGNPAAVFGVDFNDPSNRQIDYVSFIGAGYEAELSPTQRISLRLTQSTYDYGGIYIYGDGGSGGRSANDDSGRASRWSTELRLLTALSPTHSLVAGVDYRNNYRGDQISYIDSPDELAADERHASRRVGIFVQDQYQWDERISTSAGLRYDKPSRGDASWSPRVGIIYRPSAQTVLKLVGGSAFRAPNLYELHYSFPDSQLGNAGLQNETIRTVEAALEHFLTPHTRLVLSLYHNRIKNLITQTVDASSGLLRFENASPVRAIGLEAEIEHQWDTGARLRFSASTQRSSDSGGVELSSSPRSMAKLNLSAPLPWSIRLGVEGQWTAKRKTELAQTAGGSGIVNLTLSRPGKGENAEFSFSVFNALDRHFDDPVGFDPALPDRDRIAQPGRTWRAALTYHF